MRKILLSFLSVFKPVFLFKKFSGLEFFRTGIFFRRPSSREGESSPPGPGGTQSGGSPPRSVHPAPRIPYPIQFSALALFNLKKNLFYCYEYVKKFDKNCTNSDCNGDLL